MRKTVILLAAAGLLFSGYLSAIKLFTATCAFNEPCPYFLGYPACWYGFAMFLILFIAALTSSYKVLAWVSGLGILFAGYFTIPEVGHLLSGSRVYSLGLPTCAYGLVFYIAIFVLAIKLLRQNKST